MQLGDIKHTAQHMHETAVYVGIQQMEYFGKAASHLSLSPYSATGSGFSVAAGRLSFVYGLKGRFPEHICWQAEP